MRAAGALLALACVSAQAGEVTVIRPTAFIGAEATYYIVLDGRPLRDIETRQHVRFDVPDGRHTLAVRCPKALALEYYETRIDDELGPAPAFFVVEPKYDCVTLQRVDARTGASLQSNTRLATRVGTTYREGRVEASTAMAGAARATAPVAGSRASAPPEAAVNDGPALTAAWIEAFNSGDVARIISLYDPQAVLIGTTARQPVAGTAAIGAYFRQMAGSAARVAQGEHRLRTYGDTVIDSGLYNFFFVREGKAELVPARYTFVYRERDGKWLIVEHHSSRVP